jgi:hypothetical protein
MPFVNKEIHINDFLELLHKRIESQGDSNARIFFEIFLQGGLLKKIKNNYKVAPDGRVNAGDFDVIYPFAVDILRNAANGSFSEHSNTYVDAHTISVAFCEELNEFFQCSGNEKFDLIPIESYVDMAIEAGIVRVKNGMISLTLKGEEMAERKQK